MEYVTRSKSLLLVHAHTTGCFKKESPEVLFNFYLLFFNFLNVRYFKQNSRRSDVMNPAPVHWVLG